MPKAAQHMLRWSTDHQTYVLSEQEKGYQALLQGEEAWWFEWLATHASFSFQGKHGHLNVHKEVRSRGEEGYWYAYQRQGKRLAKHYVGRTPDLALAHL